MYSGSLGIDLHIGRDVRRGFGGLLSSSSVFFLFSFRRLQDVRIAHEILQRQQERQQHAGLPRSSIEIEGLPPDEQDTQDLQGNSLPTAASPLPHADATAPGAACTAEAPDALKLGGHLSSSGLSFA